MGKPIEDAFDQEIAEPCYLDEMSTVFKLGIICTGSQPSSRPSMKEVLQILNRYNHQPHNAEKNATKDRDATPLLGNSKREDESTHLSSNV